MAAPGGAVVRHGDGAGDAAGVLDVEVGFDAGGRGRAGASVDGRAGEALGLVGEVRVRLEERGEVGLDGVFLEEPGYAEETGGLVLGVGEVVQVGETGGRDARAAASRHGLDGLDLEIIRFFGERVVL